MIQFEFRARPRCLECRHLISSSLIKDGAEIFRISCSFRKEQAGHARVPKWCPEYAYLHDGIKEEG